MSQNKILVVDIDGSLLKTDLLIESWLILLKTYPLKAFLSIFKLLSGKASFKDFIAQYVLPSIVLLPARDEVLKLIEQKKATGYRIVLASASPTKWVNAVAEHFGLFDEVYASDSKTNLSGDNKGLLLKKKFGDNGFEYVGDANVDLKVWQYASKAYICSHNQKLKKQAATITTVDENFILQKPKPLLKLWLKQLRLYQWVKNALIFVPIIVSHQLNNLDILLNTVFAFIGFGLMASSVYVVNDLLDLDNDRNHERKKNRPFASGSLPLLKGLMVAPILVILSFALSIVYLPWQFVAVLLFYTVVTTGYSFYFKKLMAVDVMLLAILYTVRIIAGMAAGLMQTSLWLLAFSMFLFLSLAFIKRYIELHAKTQQSQELSGRGYQATDLHAIGAMGIASAYASVVVLALYVNDTHTKELYENPNLILLACPILLFWLTYLWFLTYRGKVDDDPIIFTFKDRVSRLCMLLVAAIFTTATFLG